MNICTNNSKRKGNLPLFVKKCCGIFILFLLYLPIRDIAYSSVPNEIYKGINKAQKNAFELIVDKDNPKRPITFRFLSDKAEICKLNLEFFPQIKFYITELDDGKEEHIFACNSFSNKAVQPTSKLENIAVSKDTSIYNQKFTEEFFNFLKDTIINNNLKLNNIKEFKVVVGLRNIFVNDSQPPGEVFTVYYETILDKKTITYFFNIIKGLVYECG